MECGTIDDGEDVEHNGVGFMEIPKIFATQSAFIWGTELWERQEKAHDKCFL